MTLRRAGVAVTTAVAPPNAPSVQPAGATVPGYDAAARLAPLAPARTPDGVVEKPNAADNATLVFGGVLKRFAELGTPPGDGSPQALDAVIAAEPFKWGKVVAAIGSRIA